jgi:glycosyltransferase involved in cell wall biosynthesis
VLASTHENIEIVLVDDGSREPLDLALLERLEREAGVAGSRFKVARHLAPRGSAAAKSSGLALATGDAVLFVDVGDLIQPAFLREAAIALSSCPDITGVLPTVGYLEQSEDLANGKCDEFATELGDAPTPGLLQSSSALHPIWRRSALPGGSFDPLMNGDSMWIAFFGALIRGARFLPTPEVAYLARKATQGEGLRLDRRSAVLGQLAPHHSRAGVRELWFASLFLALPDQQRIEQPPLQETSSGPPVPLRYVWIDLANGLFKRAGPLHSRLKLALSRALSRRDAHELPPSPGSVRPLRHQLADRLNATLKGVPRAHRLLRRLGGETPH